MNLPRTVSAPGSTMLTGEHAVVYGHPAIVVAIEQRVHVTVRPVNGNSATITSEIADPQTIPLDALHAEGPYRFVIAALQRHTPAHGVQIDIRSQIDHTLGLGSSAAVTIATLAALSGHAEDSLHADALSIVRRIQGRGSGADLAASLRGGTLAYSVSGDLATFDPLPHPPQLSLHNVGYKTPTAEVLRRVAEAQASEPARYDALYAEMGKVAARTITKATACEDIGSDLRTYQMLMAKLGVSDANLDAANAQALENKGVLGAKISGSGLGDCVIAMGAVPKGFTPVTIAPEGVIFHGDA